MTHFGTEGPPSVVPLGELTETDAARITEALQKSRADNTRRAYRSTWRAWQGWAEARGHQPLPASTSGVAAYLAERAAHGAAADTLNAIRAGISATHRDHDLPDPTDNQGIRQMLKGSGGRLPARARGKPNRSPSRTWRPSSPRRRSPDLARAAWSRRPRRTGAAL